MIEKSRLERAVVAERATVRDALSSLNDSACQIVIVQDEVGKVVGLMTDGDLRRALLAGATLESPIKEHVRRAFTSVEEHAGRADVLDLMQALRISEVPSLDEAGRLVGLHLMHDVVGRPRRENWAVVMAGGRGSRLAPLTDSVPKPMVRVAGRPILERIVLSLVGAGITRIFLSIHHLGEVIENHFGDGSRFGSQIHYLREGRPLGTAGALSLLPEPPRHPVLVMNGDLMTQADLGVLLDAHERTDRLATVAVRRYTHTVPFGCLELEGEDVVALEEKPSIHRLINAGIYVIDPALVRRTPSDVPITMPELLSEFVATRRVGAWEIEDDWIDVGERKQLDRARGLT